MKNYCIYLLLLLSFSLFSQQRATVSLDWIEKSKVGFDDFSVIVPQFNPENFFLNDSKMEILFLKKIPVSSLINENSLLITDVVYETISTQQLGDLSLSIIPNTIKASVKNIISREDIKALISISPIIKEGTEFKKIKSFTYSFDFGDSQAKSAATSSIFNSVLSSGKWYRFYVQNSGVFKITKTFLNSLGFSTDGIDPRTIKIYGNGGRMIPLTNNVKW